MRILYHHRTRAEDAQGIHIHEMVKALRDLGHEVDVVALVEPESVGGRTVFGSSWRRLVRWTPAWLYELMSLTYNLYGYRRICREIRRRRPAFIYERYSLNTVCGVLASRRFGIPLVLEVNAPLAHEQDALGELAFKRLARFSERWICSRSSRTVAVSRVLKDFLVHQGVPAEHVVVMPNGIDPRQFHPDVSGAAVRARYGLQGRCVIGFVGWFRKWHGIESLLEVMHGAQLADRGVRLLMVGDGPAYPDLRRRAAELGLLSVVTFTGPVRRDEIPAHVAAMDIAVQPSAPDYACPMKILEYLGMGSCVVAPDQPNIREIIEDRATGFLFRPGDKEALKMTLVEVLEAPVERAAVARRGHESVFTRGFLWRANAEKTLALIFGEEGSNASSRDGDHLQPRLAAPVSQV